MSPGIVRFYFASKAAMLVASLQFLAAEFEEQLLVPVARLKSRPVAALELMVDLYLDPEIASPRKVSVWYAFWGEASSRQEYYDICGQKDESFAALVRELIERLIVETSQPQLDPDGIALGLIGVLEMLWQDFAFRTEADIDRAAAKHRAMAYLRSIFPGQFAASRRAMPARAASDRRPAGWVYANARLFAVEREAVFQDSWQFAAHQAQIPRAGDFLAVDLGFERALVVRDAAGRGARVSQQLQRGAAHTARGRAPAASTAFSARFMGCNSNSTAGAAARAGPSDLTALDLRMIGRPDSGALRGAPLRQAAGRGSLGRFLAAAGCRPLGPPAETAVAADWKLVIEQWLESATSGGSREADARRLERSRVQPASWEAAADSALAAAIPRAESPDRAAARRLHRSAGAAERAGPLSVAAA